MKLVGHNALFSGYGYDPVEDILESFGAEPVSESGYGGMVRRGFVDFQAYEHLERQSVVELVFYYIVG